MKNKYGFNMLVIVVVFFLSSMILGAGYATDKLLLGIASLIGFVYVNGEWNYIKLANRMDELEGRE